MSPPDIQYAAPDSALMQELLDLNQRLCEYVEIYGLDAALDWSAQQRKVIMEKYK